MIPPLMTIKFIPGPAKRDPEQAFRGPKESILGDPDLQAKHGR